MCTILNVVGQSGRDMLVVKQELIFLSEFPDSTKGFVSVTIRKPNLAR